MRRRTLVHAHFVDMAHHLLGPRGIAMVVDACRAHAHRKVLEEALGCRMRDYVDDVGVPILSFIQETDQWIWVGGELQLTRILPHTVQDDMTGRRLGDVVQGCGAEHRRIRATCARQEGTRIFLEPDMVDPALIPIPPRLRFGTPFRRLRNHLVQGWLEMAEAPGMSRPSASDLLLQTFFIVVFVCGAVLGSLLLFAAGPYGIAADVATIPFILWALSAMMVGLARWAWAYRRTRTKD